MSFFRRHTISVLSIASIFLLFLAYNYKLVLHPSTALTDWLDYPLIVFILEQNIKHLSQLDFANLFNITSYYPSPGGMLFTDILFLQGILGTLIHPFTKNYILTHNIIFFLTALTNIISLHYFWGKVFKQKTVVFLLSLLFTFSPYYFTLYVHYQMLPYSLFFFSAGLLLDDKTYKAHFWAGILAGLQFLAGIYLGFYGLMFAGFYYLWKLFTKEKLQKVVKNGLLYGVGFVLIAGFFIYKYAAIQREYNIERDAGMYIDLAIQPSDILFTPYPSCWQHISYNIIQIHNHRRGTETFTTGFVLLSASILGAYLYKKGKHKKKITLLFVIVLLWGIIGALGPRLTINGRYLAIPLPYILPLKLTPFFDALRATGRWFFFIQIAVLYFVGYLLLYMHKQFSAKKFWIIVILGITLYSFELLPRQQRTAVEKYQQEAYLPLQEHCVEGDVLLEYPFRPMQPKTHVTTTLNYWVKMLLNQMHHDCYIVNGYSGFDPQHYLDFRDAFEIAVLDQNSDTITDLLNGKEVTFIKVNKKMLLPNSLETIESLLDPNKYEQLLNDQDNLILHKKH